VAEQDLAGRGIVVTGGAGDIGLAMGKELASRGASVTLVDVVPPSAAAERVGDMSYAQVDVRDRAGIDALFAGLERLDVAIANAGIVTAQPFLDIDATSWQDQLDVNLTGVFHTLQSAAREFVARRQPGQVIVTGSWIGTRPWPEDAAYSATKAAIQMLAKTAALELAQHGVRVNVVAPGIVEAGLAGRQLRTEPQYVARAVKAVPLGRFQTPEQVAKVTAFLCSDAADYMTGSVLLADGGSSLGGQLEG
jgi:NAD(P)-dependent dehydrogenase (short-subunit alcohol dehydrogenase family)